MQLGERLQKIRSDNNLTQEELATLLHVTRQTVSNWEHEKWGYVFGSFLLLRYSLKYH